MSSCPPSEQASSAPSSSSSAPAGTHADHPAATRACARMRARTEAPVVPQSSEGSEAFAPRGMTVAQADEHIERYLTRSPFVRFMVEKLDEAGCGLARPFFKAADCSQNAVGGFEATRGITICANNLHCAQDIELTLTHELVHAYDHCRAKNMEWRNCHHHACSEIRASNLSGECHFWQEVFRGNFGLRAQHQACVRRRAEMSVNMNPYCTGKGKESVDAVFEQCFKDTAPFDRIP